MAMKNRTLLEIYNKTNNTLIAERHDIGMQVDSFYRLISDFLSDILKDFVRNSSLKTITKERVDEYLLSAINSGIIIPLEDKFKYPLERLDPAKVLRDKIIAGVDGGAFSVRFHPLRLIIAKSAVFVHSQKFSNLNFRGIWRTSIGLLRRTGNIDELLRRKIRKLLVEVESATVRELLYEYGDELDAIFWDGPLYTSRFFENLYEVVKEAKFYSVPIIKIVKNAFSTRITSFLGLEDISDADLFSVYLDKAERSATFLYDGGFAKKLPMEFKPVFFFVKTPNKVIVRYEFPYWVYESYGLKYIEAILTADMALGGGLSYVISKADQIARFSDQERRRIVYHIMNVLRRNGLDDVLFFNERRWSKFLVV